MGHINTIEYRGVFRHYRDIMSGYWLDSVDNDWMKSCNEAIDSSHIWATSRNEEEYQENLESRIVKHYIKKNRPDIYQWLGENKTSFVGKVVDGTAWYPFQLILLLDKGTDNELAFKLRFKITQVMEESQIS